MSRFARCATFLIALLVTALARADGQRPNLVVFISDDHSYLDTSLAGSGEFPTPNLARIASQGMTLTHVFATSPSCAPSRASFLTGLMPMRSGSMLNHQPPATDVKKLPGYLKELGYTVVAFGKVAHYGQGKDYGFDLVSHDTFHDDSCVRAAVQYLDERKRAGPLCLLVGTNWPHVPWPAEDVLKGADRKATEHQPPPSHIDTPETRDWRARYAAAIRRYDDDLGQFFDAAVERLGPNTLFIHYSDHGAQWPFGKWNVYDAGTRVPCVAVWPGVIKPGGKSDAMISLVDVLPTLIEAAGGTPPADIDGRSFANVIRGTKQAHREYIFTTHSGDGRMNRYPMRSVRSRDWKYVLNLDPQAQHTTHIDRGKAVDGNAYWRSWVERGKSNPAAAAIVARYHRRPAEELYDLRNDPHEINNVAGDRRYAERLRDLRRRLDVWMREQSDEGLATERALYEPR